MAWVGDGIIVWKGDSGSHPGNLARTWVPSLLGATQLNTFATYLSSFTDCNKFEVIQKWMQGFAAGPPGAGANTDLKAVISYRDPDSLIPMQFSWPAVESTSVETTPQGKRLKWLVVTDLVANLSTMAGISYIPLWGGVYTKT